MEHNIANYEKRIKELQSLYDQDVFTLEKENTKLHQQIKDLQSHFVNVSNSNSSLGLDFEELKTSYNDKIDNLKSHYEDLLQKECSSAQQQQTELVAENSKLQVSGKLWLKGTYRCSMMKFGSVLDVLDP